MHGWIDGWMDNELMDGWIMNRWTDELIVKGLHLSSAQSPVKEFQENVFEVQVKKVFH